MAAIECFNDLRGLSGARGGGEFAIFRDFFRPMVRVRIPLGVWPSAAPLTLLQQSMRVKQSTQSSGKGSCAFVMVQYSRFERTRVMVRHHITVLHLPLVVSSLLAVRATLVQ